MPLMQAEPAARPPRQAQPGAFRSLLRARLGSFAPNQLLLLAALIALLPLLQWQLRSLGLPLLGEHNWRQADTYSVAYNFLHESADFFHPRIDWANNRSGIMGMEAPIYPYLCFLAMTVFGDAPAVARSVAWLLGALGLFLFARYLRPPGRVSVAFGALLFFFFSPMGMFEFRQVQPDGPMAALTMIAAACLHQFARSERRAWFAAGLGVYTLAALAKVPALAAGPAMWLFSWTAKPTSVRKIAVRGAWFALPLLAAVAWNAWARHLNQAYNDGETYFAIDFSLKGMLADATHRGQLRHLFGSVLTTYVSSWVLFPAVLVGAALGFEPHHRPVAAPMAVWFAGAALFLAAFSSRLLSHWYYTVVMFPPVLYFGALGLGRLIDLAGAPPPPVPLSRWAAVVLIPALALAPWVGGEPGSLEVPGGTGFPANTTWMGELSLLGLLALFALATGALKLRARAHRPYLWFVLVLAASVPGLSRAAHDTIAGFKWRSREPEWKTAHSAWNDLRQAVDRYSTRQDRFVVDGANPWYLYLPLRKGWNLSAHDLSANGADSYRKQGARFLIHYLDAGPKPHGLKREQLLARGANWELYCLAEQGCPARPVASSSHKLSPPPRTP
jgi:hypothetical protein